MEYVIDIGQQLFAYKNLKHGQRLDYTYFWGGRSSCKRAFLTRHGVFNQSFRSIIEDIELGYRLSKVNLHVVFHRLAESHMVRPITYDDFCRRCERVGAALYRFDQLHKDPGVQQYCQVAKAKASWDQVGPVLGMAYYRVREIESPLESEPERAKDPAVRAELQRMYKWVFDGFKMRGIINAERVADPSLVATAPTAESPVVQPVVVFQMGKVGSKSVESSLKRYDFGAPICHSHLLNNLDQVESHIRTARANPSQSLAEIRHGKQLRKVLLGSPYLQNRVVTMVRDPVARNISAFFENIAEYVPDYRERQTAGELAIGTLIETFLAQYEHDIPLNWFDCQLRPVFDVDVYAEPFPKDRGYAIYSGPRASVLLLKLERLKECAAPAMKEFLGIEDFVLTNTNVGEDKDYRDVYRAFVDAIRLPASYLDRMYDSRLARHFYTDDEVRRFRSRWSRRPALAVAQTG
jgi:hypothetical protein